MTSPRTQQNYINGTWVDSAAAQVSVVNPATSEVVTVVPDSDASDVDAAVRAAHAARTSWRRTNPFQRAAYLHAIADQIADAVDAIASEITLEMGKPLDEARGEVRKAGEAFHFYAEETTRTFGQIIPNSQDGFTSLVEKEPVGVVGAISPWNYPVELITWKLAASLGAGCTIVVKPSEYSPSSAVELFRCVERAGVPAGVANLVLGAGQPGKALVSHPLLNKVAFTGSNATGGAISRSTSAAIPLSMELGGNCPLIVTAHADVPAAVAGTVRRSFRNAGQICIAINRAYVHADVYQDYLQKVAKATAQLSVGDGLANPGADVGPVTTQEIFDRTGDHIEDAKTKGATVVQGGGPIADLAPGLFFEPTVLADCTQDMLLMHDETFGPVLGVSSFTQLDDAIERANSTFAGLAAYAYTTDLTETFRLGRDLDYGNVAINNVDAGIINAPYGGRKGSGYGYEHGREGLEGYLQLKHLRIHHGQ